MRPSTSVFLRYECIVAVVALIAAAIQWHKAGWSSALFIFVWIFVLINIPLLWYLGKSTVADWWRRRRS
jgi:hypothetical protein